MATATKTYMLVYCIMILRDGGNYAESGSTEFGTETQADAGQFDSAEDAFSAFRDYLTEQSNGATVEDVTEAEGFQGWGTVIRVSHKYGDMLYSVSVS